jgi:hypothetical protein
MDAALAKEFILLNDYLDSDNKIYISKDLSKLLEINRGNLVGIYGVIDTECGEKLMTMDWSYGGEPILMRVFLHKEYFLNNYWNREIVNL